MTVTASAISGILKKAGFKRANPRGNSWFSGFEVSTYPGYVRVDYSSATAQSTADKYQAIIETINGRPGKKYWAALVAQDALTFVKVTAYDETDPGQNEARKAEALERLAADHPAAPEIATVKRALRTYSQYDADFQPAHWGGYKVERLEGDSRLVRVRLVEGVNPTYSEISRDDHIAQTLANYARVVHAAGFEFQVRDDEMSVIVAEPGEWNNALAAETVETILRSAHPIYSAKSGGFVIRQYAKDAGALRVEYHDGIGQDEKVRDIGQVVERYGRILAKAGYATATDPQNPSVLLVAVATPQVAEEAPKAPETDQEVREALLTLRELVEADSQFASTRRAGDHSVFVMAFGARVEVFYSNGEYKTKLGKGDWQRFPAVNSELLDFIVKELNGLTYGRAALRERPSRV